MSWSRNYTGTAAECAAKAQMDVEDIKAPLPDFERDDVSYVVGAACQVLERVPNGAQVSLTVSGHGWRDTTGKGAGGQGISISYSIPKQVAAGS